MVITLCKFLSVSPMLSVVEIPKCVCMFLTFNILLESKINISLCTDLIFTDNTSLCRSAK